MKKYVLRIARRVAPDTLSNVRTLNTLDKQFDQGPARFISYERELAALRRDIDALRRDNRRVAELYDVVFARARADAAAAGRAPAADRTTGLARIADELRDDDADGAGTPPAAGDDAAHD